MDVLHLPRGEGLKRLFAENVILGKVYDLGQPLQRGMPLSPLNPPFFFTLSNRHGDRVTSQGVSAANDLISMGSHQGTHIDALGHISKNGTLHGGTAVSQSQVGAAGLASHGIEGIPPVIRRGVLLDVASLNGMDFLPAGYVVTAEELEQSSIAQGSRLEPGDAVLIRTGWAKNWQDPAVYPGQESGAPGVGLEAAQWLASKQASVVGSDNMSFEVRPSPGFLSIHGLLLVDHGIPIMENLFLEDLCLDKCFTFVFMALPLKIVGGTASPVRPIAIA